MGRFGRKMVLALLALLLTGCPFVIGAGMGVGTYKVIQGDLVRLYRASYDRAWEAAFTTLEEMEMTVVDQEKGEAKGKIQAKRFDESPVRLMIRQKALDVTELCVRVGPVGDREKAELFHEHFRDNVFD